MARERGILAVDLAGHPRRLRGLSILRQQDARVQRRGDVLTAQATTNRAVEDLATQLVLDREHVAGRCATDSALRALADIEGDLSSRS